MPLVRLLILFITVPLVELYLIFEVVGDGLGVLWTIALLAASSVLGAVLLRSQGRAVWGQFQRALGEGRMPHREVIEGVLVIFGGAFLITPGFLTDIVGILLLVPPSRALARRALARRLVDRGVRRAPDARPRPREDVVDGTASEHEAPVPRIER